MLWSLKISIGFPWRLCRTLIFFLLFAILIQSWLLVMADNGVDLDKFTLLQFKSSVSSDPAGFLSSWNLSHGDHCSWYGVSCNSQSRVVSINISGADGSDGVFCSSLRGKSNTFSCSGLIRSPFSLNRFVKSCNGTVFGSEMAGWGRIACRMKGELSPFIGNLTELRVLSLSFNEFEGEIPAEIGLLGNLEVLELEGNLFTGLLPFEFGGLKALRVLNLGYNKIIGEIPSTLSGCVKLQILDLSGNGLNGTIPEFLGKSSDLRGLFLALNQLSGTVHDELGNHCDYLEHLDLSMNYLTGGIPSNFGNCNNLKSLLLFSNMFEDAIPPNLGKLSMLEALDVSRNSLSGPIPAELGNCLQLSVVVLSNLYDPLSLGDNSSTDPVIGFSNDGRDDYNCFRGGIPVTITALPKLRIIWAPRSTLEGEIPSNWGVCGNLEMVNLADNRFTGEIPTAFSRCKNLHYLELSSNKLTGELNEELPVPCMTMFDVSGNHLSGYIPRFLTNTCPQAPFENKHGVISNASAVQNDLAFAYSLFFACRTRTSISLPSSGSDDLAIFHNFNGNNFTGHVPPLPIANDKLEQRPIYVFLAGRNSLNGSLSGHLFDKCNDLNGLVANLSNNEISGEFPEGIGTMCKSLRLLDVAANLITGSIPSSFGLLLSLVSLDLSKNQLHGQIPMDLLRLKDLQHLSLAGNNLTGAIPTGLGQLSSLEVLELSLNSLSGEIPRDLSNLRKLTVLLLDHNNLSGQIPSGFANIPSLSVFNVSFNNLSGPIPTNSNSMTCNSALGNPLLRSCPMFLLSVPSADLQGQYVDSQHHADSPSRSMSQNNSGFNSIEIALITFTSAIVSVLVALVFLIVYTRKCRPRSSFQGSRSSFQGSGRREVIIFSDIGVPLTFEIVFQATGGFHTSNCIGHGGFGATYKAEISPGVLVAVKRLSVGRFQGVQQFSAEIRTLGRMRHPNLVTLIGYHASETEMFLIYNYLPGGNLEKFIQKRSERPIDWRILHKIALDIARALAYLHGQCVPRVLHRDIKPSNILLDNDFNAYLSDFGMARLLGTSETHATTNVTGTFGYVAPEYAMTCRVSDKADVYSFGVVLLELISDKKALDPSFSSYGNGFNIVAWACMLLRQGQAREFFTAGLWDAGPHDNLVETLHLAVMCTVDSISIRPSMKQVVQRFKQLQPPTC